MEKTIRVKFQAVKKALLFVMVLTMIICCMSIGSSAATAGPAYGDVPKTAEAITLDGVKDPVYNGGLRLLVDQWADGSANKDLAYVSVYAVYDANYLYVFCECHDSYFISDAETIATAYSDCKAWSLDNVELFVDWDNAGIDNASLYQYRICYNGWLSGSYGDIKYNGTDDQRSEVGNAGGEILNTDNYFNGMAVLTDYGFDCEYQIPLQNGTGEGSVLGMAFNYSSRDSEEGRSILSNNSGIFGWGVDKYGQVTLGNETAVIPEVTAEEPSSAETTPDAAAETPAATTAESPLTADISAVYAVMALLSAAGMVFAAKKR